MSKIAPSLFELPNKQAKNTCRSIRKCLVFCSV